MEILARLHTVLESCVTRRALLEDEGVVEHQQMTVMVEVVGRGEEMEDWQEEANQEVANQEVQVANQEVEVVNQEVAQQEVNQEEAAGVVVEREQQMGGEI